MLGGWLDLMILEVFSNLNDSMIQWNINLNKNSTCIKTCPPSFIILAVGNIKIPKYMLIKTNIWRYIWTYHHSNITPFASLKAKQMD